jgi:hypothetical protein
MKSLIYDTFINGSAWIGTILTWQQELDFWIKIMAGASAVILSWVTIYIKIKNDRKNK